jgi:predicted TPR repeat methyltransferase
MAPSPRNSTPRPEPRMNRKERRLARKRDDFQALVAHALARERQDRLGEAMDAYRRALAVRPDCAPVRNNLAALLKKLRRFEEAAVELRTALAHDPQLPEAHSNLGGTLIQLGRVDEGMAHYQQAIAIKPDFVEPRLSLAICYADRQQFVEALSHAEILSWASEQPGFPLFRFGVLMTRCNCTDLARHCFERYLAQDPQDKEGARALLARLGYAALPERTSATQIDEIYSWRALSWDLGSRNGADHYRGARLVATAVEQLLPDRTDLDIMDAGCGTGLVGELVAQRARRLEGIDMSAPMLAKAKEKGAYHRLHQGDLVALLRAHEQEFDVVTCAATLIHFGELDAAFEAAATCLRDGGYFVLTLFPNEQDANAVAVAPLGGLGEAGCFVHGPYYVARVAQATGFTVRALQTEVHEFARGKPRMGLVVALRRDARASIVPAQSPAAETSALASGA